MIDWIRPDWTAPANVKAASTTRNGGVSEGPWSSLNLASHVGDNAQAVAENRRRLRNALNLPAEPAWLEQVHGTDIVSADRQGDCADACVSDSVGRVCVVMTADCLPVLFCNRAGTRVAAAHAGWRGLSAGILESTLAALVDPPSELMAWLGPAIGPDAFEVGSEVRDAFVGALPEAEVHFKISRPGHWFADLYGLARQRLMNLGLTTISGGQYCTFGEAGRFFSYRRDGVTGRMATLAWLDPE
jgi:YfiH family protein